MKKTSKYKHLRFKSQKELKKWLNEKGAYAVHLEDRGQDMQKIIVDSEGEILDCDFHGGIYNGCFVDTSFLRSGEALRVWDNNGNCWGVKHGLIIEEVII